MRFVSGGGLLHEADKIPGQAILDECPRQQRDHLLAVLIDVASRPPRRRGDREDYAGHAAEPTSAATSKRREGSIRSITAFGVAFGRRAHEGRISKSDAIRHTHGMALCRVHVSQLRRDLESFESLNDITRTLEVDIEEAVDRLADLVPKLRQIDAQLTRRDKIGGGRQAAKETHRLDVAAIADEELVAVVDRRSREIRERWPDRPVRSYGVGAGEVAQELAGGQVDAGTSVRIGQRLGRLAREGLLMIVSNHSDHRRWYALPAVLS